MKDSDCVQFLQWALPQLQMRWQGFRKVRRQVCKRIGQRVGELRLSGLQDYRRYLETEEKEWRILDTLCRVTISRFYRDKLVFSVIEKELLPALAREAIGRGQKSLQIWSAGCAAGEEPYTLALVWELGLRNAFPALGLHILATDIDPQLLQRARKACYPWSSIRNIPQAWQREAFIQFGESYCLIERFREPVEFRLHDVREKTPEGPFDLVACRNLVFTYFDDSLQREFLGRVHEALTPKGVLILGVHESLPEGSRGFRVVSARLGI